jgi:quercetin dioxygenase-like cupin family protein
VRGGAVRYKGLFMKHTPLFIAMACLGLGVSVVRSQERPASNPYTQAVVREVLAKGYPTADRKQVLELTRFTIAPKAKLPVHSHPGMQIERVLAGLLTYTVVSGEAQVMRGDGSELLLEAGKTTVLRPGDSLVETAGMVHFGENRGEEAVVLLSSSLFDAGKPKAIF